MNHEQQLVECQDISSVFVDAHLHDEHGRTIFMSLIGRDTQAQELIAKLSIPVKDGGLNVINLKDGSALHLEPTRLEKDTARIKDTIMGSLLHMVFADPKTKEADLANLSAVLIVRDDESPEVGEHQAWHLVKQIIPLPVSDLWRNEVMKFLREQKMVQKRQGRAVTGWFIDIDEIRFQEFISHMIRTGGLTVEPLINSDLKAPEILTDRSIFSDAPIISSYTRAEAIEDGFLVDITESRGAMLRELGITTPLAISNAVWHDCVAWPEEAQKKTVQDEDGRLYDVLYMLRRAIQASTSTSSTILYTIARVEPTGYSRRAKDVELKATIGPGDTPEPVLTILFPYED